MRAFDGTAGRGWARKIPHQGSRLGRRAIPPIHGGRVSTAAPHKVGVHKRGHRHPRQRQSRRRLQIHRPSVQRFEPDIHIERGILGFRSGPIDLAPITRIVLLVEEPQPGGALEPVPAQQKHSVCGLLAVDFARKQEPLIRQIRTQRHIIPLQIHALEQRRAENLVPWARHVGWIHRIRPRIALIRLSLDGERFGSLTALSIARRDGQRGGIRRCQRRSRGKHQHGATVFVGAIIILRDDFRRGNRHRRNGPVRRRLGARRIAEFLEELPSVGDLAKNRVFEVQIPGPASGENSAAHIAVGDKELGAVGALVVGAGAGVSHGKLTASGESHRSIKLVGKPERRPSRTRALRIAPLKNKTLRRGPLVEIGQPMKDHPVVEARLREPGDVTHSQRSPVTEQLKHQVPAISRVPCPTRMLKRQFEQRVACFNPGSNGVFVGGIHRHRETQRQTRAAVAGHRNQQTFAHRDHRPHFIGLTRGGYGILEHHGGRLSLGTLWDEERPDSRADHSGNEGAINFHSQRCFACESQRGPKQSTSRK